mgnify:CR=1 FL=1
MESQARNSADEPPRPLSHDGAGPNRKRLPSDRDLAPDRAAQHVADPIAVPVLPQQIHQLRNGAFGRNVPAADYAALLKAPAGLVHIHRHAAALTLRHVQYDRSPLDRTAYRTNQSAVGAFPAP